MRTTINIDDDLVSTLKSMADLRKSTMGDVVSDLLRTGLERKTTYDFKEGLPVFEVREGARTISMEDIKSAEDEV
ncbi:MAG: hypothetical protein PQJ59_14830 [Spirochaetales bacterium]|nr:hypothetical protein [Spirochaetales bacterium]